MSLIVFAHGINNENNSSASIERDWRHWIAEQLEARHNFRFSANDEFVAPFYGDLLEDGLRRGRADTSNEANRLNRRHQGNAFFRRLGLRTNSQSAPSANRPLSRIGRLNAPLESRHSNWLSNGDTSDDIVYPNRYPLSIGFIGRLLGGPFFAQGIAYYRSQDVQEAVETEVHATVGPAVESADPGRPYIVVAHSMGAAIMYRYFTGNRATRQPDLFITMGSPLTLKEIQKGIKRPIGCLANTYWLNVYDKDDPVAGGGDVNDATFNCRHVDNRRVTNRYASDPGIGHKHSLSSYLQKPEVIDRFHQTIN